jgi:hypothetical protein
MATILTENFNSYNNGDLNGQGSWTADTVFDIQGSVVVEGAKAVSATNPDGDYVAVKAGTARTTGTVGCYMRSTVNNVANSATFAIREGADYLCSVNFASNGHIQGQRDSGTDDLGAYSINTWYWVEIYWETSPAHKVKFKVNDGSYSALADPFANWSTAPDTIRFYSAPGTYTSYYDYIAESILAQETINAPLGTITLTGYTPTIIAVATKYINAVLGLLNLIGNVPTLNVKQNPWKNQNKSATVTFKNENKHNIT